MFANFKLRERIFVAFSIPAVLFFEFGGLAHSIYNQLSETFKQVKIEQKTLGKLDKIILNNSILCPTMNELGSSSRASAEQAESSAAGGHQVLKLAELQKPSTMSF